MQIAKVITRAGKYLKAYILLLSLSFGMGTFIVAPLYAQRSDKTNTTQPLNKPAIHEIPVLCYHQVRDYKSSDSRTAKAFIIPPDRFRDHMKMLHDSGYHSILPDELVRYNEGKIILPPKAVMLTFDDGTLSEYENALPVLERYGLKAVFFIMTVTIDKPGYMSRKQIKELSDKGHVIGCHTWDHHNVTRYIEQDWDIQLVKPTKVLKEITGRQVKYFAYPFGEWNETAVTRLRQNNYNAAFQLSRKKMSENPLYTVRRIIADGSYSAYQLHGAMKKSFQ